MDWSLLFTLVKTAAVIGVLLVTLKLIARFNGAKQLFAGNNLLGNRRRLELIERLPLGRASSLVLLRIGEQHYALSVTEKSVDLLLEVELDDDDSADVDVADVLNTSHPRTGAEGARRRWSELLQNGRSVP